MNRLSTELKRLYLPHELDSSGLDPTRQAPSLASVDGLVRSMVIELRRPEGWNAAARLWQGVQDEIGLPAPAIAVNGLDGYQLWFSLEQPVSLTQAAEFLELLRQRFLGEINPRHVGLLPASDAVGHARHARLVPFELAGTNRWTAFVSPDLASLFGDEPWLDLPPGADAQADLLLRLKRIAPETFRLALERLSRPHLQEAAGLPSAAAVPDMTDRPDAATTTGTYHDPRQFLLDVINDGSVAMSLRIEAAKALLQGQTAGLTQSR